MNSIEALVELIVEAKSLNRNDSRLSFLRNEIEKDLEIVECFKKIPKQDLKDFIEWQIRYEKNMKTWLEGCNADLSKEEPTKHLIKIKEWLNEKEKEERVEND